MEVQVISNTAQKFNGQTYYLCGNYYQRKGRRLHRAVWEYHNGDIPKGFHIHHKDKNRGNNQIENLELVKASEHLSDHMKEQERVEESRRTIAKAVQAARAWHGTEDGYAWHSQHAREYWANAQMNTYRCDFCGKEFETRHVYGKDVNRFCHQNCKAKFRNRRLRRENQERNASRQS